MKKALKLIHVDDEQISLDLLKKLIGDRLDIEYLGGFQDAVTAAEFLENNQVDIAILDIEMDGENGLWLAEQIKDLQVYIIFLSAHTGYALQAFEACALDYLVKPLAPTNFEAALERYRQREDKTKMNQLSQVEELFERYLSRKSIPQRLFVSMVGEIRIVMLKDILYFSANESYTIIYLKDGTNVMVSKRLKVYVEALENHPDFLRLHRSFLANKAFIKQVSRDGSKNRYIAIMSNEAELEISYSRREEIMAQIAIG